MNTHFFTGIANILHVRRLTVVIALFFVILISGCAILDQHDRGALTKFDPISEYNTYTLWRYEAVAITVSSSYGMTDEGEATRMRWLIEQMQMNNLPIVGYEIVDKKTVLLRQGWGGASYRIIYMVKIPKGNGSVK